MENTFFSKKLWYSSETEQINNFYTKSQFCLWLHNFRHSLLKQVTFKKLFPDWKHFISWVEQFLTTSNKTRIQMLFTKKETSTNNLCLVQLSVTSIRNYPLTKQSLPYKLYKGKATSKRKTFLIQKFHTYHTSLSANSITFSLTKQNHNRILWYSLIHNVVQPKPVFHQSWSKIKPTIRYWSIILISSIYNILSMIFNRESSFTKKKTNI